jgi:hypothetical protein
MKGPSKPEHVREIYDNGGETCDRYTVLTTWPENPTGCYMALGLSDNPTHPQGFSQWTAAMPGRHLGKRVPWAEVPEHIRVHVVARMAE